MPRAAWRLVRSRQRILSVTMVARIFPARPFLAVFQLPFQRAGQPQRWDGRREQVPNGPLPTHGRSRPNISMWIWGRLTLRFRERRARTLIVCVEVVLLGTLSGSAIVASLFTTNTQTISHGSA